MNAVKEFLNCYDVVLKKKTFSQCAQYLLYSTNTICNNEQNNDNNKNLKDQRGLYIVADSNVKIERRWKWHKLSVKQITA